MKRKKGELTEAEATKNALRQIMAVVAVGMVLAAADFMISSGSGEADVEHSGDGTYLVRPQEGEESRELSIVAKIKGKDGAYEKEMNIMLDAHEKEKTQEKSEADGEGGDEEPEDIRVERDLEMIAEQINDDITKRRITLPKELEGGEKIIWTVEPARDSNAMIIAAMTALICVMLYRERFSAIRRREREHRESVLRRLPGFINRLVLLLNAGLVLSSAFQVAVEESIAGRESEKDYFYRNLKGIYVAMRTANVSMENGLREFAARSKVRELMRISNIIDDNISKGTELTYKLQNESRVLWTERKKKCEEMGKLAETKLTLPLVLFLMVLIVITIAPAMLEL